MPFNNCISMGNGIRRISGSPDQPYRWRRWRQGIRYDTLPSGPMERGHLRYSGRFRQHRFIDEQSGRFAASPLGRHRKKMGCTDSHHSARHSDIHRRLFQPRSYRGSEMRPSLRKRRDQGKAGLSYRLHSSTGLHFISAYLESGQQRYRASRYREAKTDWRFSARRYLLISTPSLPSSLCWASWYWASDFKQGAWCETEGMVRSEPLAENSTKCRYQNRLEQRREPNRKRFKEQAGTVSWPCDSIIMLIIVLHGGMVYSRILLMPRMPTIWICGLSFVASNAFPVGLVIGSLAALILPSWCLPSQDSLSFTRRWVVSSRVRGDGTSHSDSLLWYVDAEEYDRLAGSAAEYVSSSVVASSASELQMLLPGIIFLVAGFLAFATGTSWEPFGILIPHLHRRIPWCRSFAHHLYLGMYGWCGMWRPYLSYQRYHHHGECRSGMQACASCIITVALRPDCGLLWVSSPSL